MQITLTLSGSADDVLAFVQLAADSGLTGDTAPAVAPEPGEIGSHGTLSLEQRELFAAQQAAKVNRPRRVIERHFKVGDRVQVKWATALYGKDLAKEVAIIVEVLTATPCTGSYMLRLPNGQNVRHVHSQLQLLKEAPPLVAVQQ